MPPARPGSRAPRGLRGLMATVGEPEAAAQDASLTVARYVAIITDGNGRWARARGVSVGAGHEAGADTVKARLRDAVQFGIRELTVYSFSTENWSRPAAEVAGLMAMFSRRIAAETPELHAEGVRMRFIGRRAGLPDDLCRQMHWAQQLTDANTRITLFVAFNYGGRAEILDAAARYAAERIAQAAAGGGAGLAVDPTGVAQTAAGGVGGGSPVDPSSVPQAAVGENAEPLVSPSAEEDFRRHLYAPEMHDPDLIIRTSGERRLSNYLLWQSAYSELVFRDELWPDFSREALQQSLDEFAARRRRFGGR